MQTWLVGGFTAILVVVLLKVAASDAPRIKRKLASWQDEDAVVNLLAWFDRVTRLRRH